MTVINRQLRKNHSLLQMIEGCLDFPENRPSIHQVAHLLDQARAEDRDEHMDINKLELVQALHAHQVMRACVYFLVLSVLTQCLSVVEFRTGSTVTFGRVAAKNVYQNRELAHAHQRLREKVL